MRRPSGLVIHPTTDKHAVKDTSDNVLSVLLSATMANISIQSRRWRSQIVLSVCGGGRVYPSDAIERMWREETLLSASLISVLLHGGL